MFRAAVFLGTAALSTLGGGACSQSDSRPSLHFSAAEGKWLSQGVQVCVIHVYLYKVSIHVYSMYGYVDMYTHASVYRYVCVIMRIGIRTPVHAVIHKHVRVRRRKPIRVHVHTIHTHRHIPTCNIYIYIYTYTCLYIY